MSCKWWRVLENRATEREWWFLSGLGKNTRKPEQREKVMCLPFALASAMSRHSFMCLMVTTGTRRESSHSLMPPWDIGFKEALGSATKTSSIRASKTWQCDFGFLKTKILSAVDVRFQTHPALGQAVHKQCNSPTKLEYGVHIHC